MKAKVQQIFGELLARLPELEGCKDGILSAYGIMAGAFTSGGKLMACGNGGSAADAEHIVGELMKGFKLKRAIPAGDSQKLQTLYPEDGARLALGLQRALPAFCLSSHSALLSAFVNDVSPAMAYAQQVYGMGRPGDALLGISTSGNSENVVNAAKVAKALGIRAIALTGGSGGKLAKFCDAVVIVPAAETYRVQEYHLPVYHALCAMLEEEFFGE